MTLDLKKIRKKYNLTQSEIAEKLGITRQLVGAIESGTPMSKSVEKSLQLFESLHPNANELQEDRVKYDRSHQSKTETVDERILNDFKALKSIAESNRMLAEAQIIAAQSSKILAESQKQLVNTNAELVTLYKQNATGSADQDKSVGVQSKLDTLLEAIAEVASGKKYHSKQEALATIGKKFYEHSGS